MADIRFCHDTYPFPSEKLGVLRDANDLLGDMDALRARMAEDGYLWIKGFFDRDAVKAARRHILAHMQRYEALVPDTPLLEGVMQPGGKSFPLMGYREVTHSDAVKRIFEGPEITAFYDHYFGEPALTFDYKWLRAVGNEEFTGAHYDVVYMGCGSPDLHTSWIPFGDLDVTNGTLAIAVGSHNRESFKPLRDTYGRIDVDRDGIAGWYSNHPSEMEAKYQAEWRTANFEMGDMVLFGMHTMHCSTTNVTGNFRLSADVRFQPASHPIDERWASDTPKGHGHVPSNAGAALSYKTIDEAKADWDKSLVGQ